MRTQQRQSAAEDQNGANGFDDAFSPAARREAAAGQTRTSPRDLSGTAPASPAEAAIQADAIQESRLTSQPPAAELDGQEEPGPQFAWVSLDALRGLLVCEDLDLEVTEFVGTIIESRVVRVMPDGDGGALCASFNRKTADVGRPGHEYASCEDRRGCCFPRWWIAWQEDETGQKFAHTLSQTGTMDFTRYAAKLKRKGVTPSQVLTRLFVEEARRQKAGTTYRRLQFEQDDPFRDQ